MKIKPVCTCYSQYIALKHGLNIMTDDRNAVRVNAKNSMGDQSGIAYPPKNVRYDQQFKEFEYLKKAIDPVDYKHSIRDVSKLDTRTMHPAKQKNDIK